MALDGFRTIDDPGLRARLLRSSNAIGCAAPRPRRRPPLCPHWMAVAEALTVVAITLIVLGWIIATP